MSNASRVEALFFAALEYGAAVERAVFLDSACQGDAELRRQVEKLLNAHPRVGAFLNKPVVEKLAAAPEYPDATQEFDTSTEGRRAQRAGCQEPALPRSERKGSGKNDHSDLEFLQPSLRPDSLGRLGHYEVLEVLGQGGFGVVFRAFDDQLQRVVAIKVLAPELAAMSPARKRFLREARSSAKVRHENVVQVYAVEEQPLPYLVMEFVPGETLQQRIDRIGPLEAMEVARIGGQIAEGLAAAHAQGLIHRDIKPANILIEAGPNQQVKITDFGLARAADDASMTQSGMVAGTPMFMAPEQASGETLDHRADLFSLGSVLYTIYSGRPPFRANSTLAVLRRVAEDTPRPIREIIPETPPWLCAIITRLHAKKPEDRFGTAREAADLLGRGLAALQHPERVAPPVVAAPAREKSEAASTIRRPGFRTRRWAVAAGVLLLLLGGLGFTEATGITDVHGTVLRLFSPEGTARKEDPIAPSTDPDRLAAEYVLSVGGMVRVNGPGKENRAAAVDAQWSENADHRLNEQGQEIRAAADLPRESFRLTYVDLNHNKQVSNAGLTVLKNCKNLTLVELVDTPVSDAALAHINNCRDLWLENTPLITDAGLAHLKDCKGLWLVHLAGLPNVTDAGLAYLKDCENLRFINLANTPVTDAGLAHLKDCKNLTELGLHNNAGITDAGLVHLADCKNLTHVNLHNTKVTATGIDELKKALPQCKIEWDGGFILPRDANDNPPPPAVAPFTDADAQRFAALPAGAQVEAIRQELMRRNPDFNGQVHPTIKDGVVTGLTIQGWVADLSPLKGMQLTSLTIMNVSRVADLTPLRGMPLQELTVWPFMGSDLTPLKGMPLKSLNCGGGHRKLDLTPLQGMPLDFLCVNHTQTSDLTPLKDLPLTTFMCADTPASDFTPLRGMALKTLHFDRTNVSDLSLLKGMPLADVECQGSGVTDLSPLKEFPLTHLDCDFHPERDAAILRAIKTLETINGKPAAQFWKEVDGKESEGPSREKSRGS